MQQAYRPIIGVHKWFARRPGTLFRALFLSEFDDEPLSDGFYQSHDFTDKVVADPFMGGGSPLIEASRLGMGVIGSDINPMAYWIVRQSLAPLDIFQFKIEAQRVAKAVEDDLGHLYKTRCKECGGDADMKYMIWAKEEDCPDCGERNTLMSNYQISSNERHPDYVWFCPDCEELAEVSESPSKNDVDCPHCGSQLPDDGNAAGKSFTCRYCDETNRYRDRDKMMSERPVAMEYHCASCASEHDGRFFKAPDEADKERIQEAKDRLSESDQSFIPDDTIPEGDETTRLHNWGYEQYRDLFNTRQLLTLNRLAGEIASVEDKEIRRALATVFSDSLRYQNMLCRYDTWALKIQDVFSIHGFPAGLVRTENNVIGIPDVGSGGFRHFIEKYERAKNYCEEPFEAVFEDGKKKGKVKTGGETIGAEFVESAREVTGDTAFLTAGDSRKLDIEDESLDAVFTDPPYFDNVQYSELMDFCYVWLKQLLTDVEEFSGNGGSTRKPEELTVNETLERGIDQFAAGLSEVFSTMSDGLKPDAPLAFTYHHNDPDAYLPLIVSILDVGLNCTTTLAAPAEMSASLHISGTGSSIIDTVFVCRAQNAKQHDPLEVVSAEVSELEAADIDLSEGDLQCMALGQISHRVINTLYGDWDATASMDEKLDRAKEVLDAELDKHPLDEVINDISGQRAEQVETDVP